MVIGHVGACLADRMLQQLRRAEREAQGHGVGCEHALCLGAAIHSCSLQQPCGGQRSASHRIVVPLVHFVLMAEESLVLDEAVLCAREDESAKEREHALSGERHFLLHDCLVIPLHHFFHFFHLLLLLTLAHDGVYLGQITGVEDGRLACGRSFVLSLGHSGAQEDAQRQDEQISGFHGV